MQDAAAWAWTDAWILCSIPARRGADLSKVIGHADAINHAIVTREELEVSLNRLATAGLVDLGARIRQSRRGRTLVRRAKGRGMLDVARSVEGLLAELPLPDSPPVWQLDKSTYEEAVNRYLARMA